MEDYQKRVVEEYDDLGIKYNKLNMFVLSGAFHQLELTNQSLLRTQAFHMFEYLKTLRRRIDTFNNPVDNTPSKEVIEDLMVKIRAELTGEEYNKDIMVGWTSVAGEVYGTVIPDEELRFGVMFPYKNTVLYGTVPPEKDKAVPVNSLIDIVKRTQ